MQVRDLFRGLSNFSFPQKALVGHRPRPFQIGMDTTPWREQLKERRPTAELKAYLNRPAPSPLRRFAFDKIFSGLSAHCKKNNLSDYPDSFKDKARLAFRLARQAITAVRRFPNPENIVAHAVEDFRSTYGSPDTLSGPNPNGSQTRHEAVQTVSAWLPRLAAKRPELEASAKQWLALAQTQIPHPSA